MEQEMREYVVSKWPLVHLCDGSYRNYPRGTVLVQEVQGSGQFHEFDSWQAAYAFTLERERQIKDVEEEINFIANLGAHVDRESFAVDIRKRTIARLQSTLAEMQRGMKTEAPNE